VHGRDRPVLVIFGAGQWVNGHGWGAYLLLFGFVWWAFVLQQWFREAIGESEGGLYSDRIDVSFRWSMSWFIFSEVMFFGAFFGALFWAPLHACPTWAASRTPCCGPTSSADLAELGARASPARRPASSSRSDHGPVADPDHQHRCCC
jgi:cytochrome c oxidase subunit 3